MSYIAFDLDALNVAPAVARAAGVREEEIIAGLVRMWAWCFREKTSTVNAEQVRGHFGCDAASALVAFGFLEAVADTWRVRGAERYLRITEARSRGGKAAAGNLKQGTRKPGVSRGLSRGAAGEQPGVQPGTSPGSTPALTPNTEHRAPELPTGARLKALTERLVATFLELRGNKYLHAGIEDATGLKRLAKDATDDEIDRRWRLALAAGLEWPGTSSLAQLAGAKRWNDLATAKPAFVSIEERPSRMM